MSVVKGVLTIAYGNAKYVQQAINLARSIRLRDPHLPLAVATDFPPSAFDGLYDPVIPWDFSQWPEFMSKLETYAITPFATTLFLDADCLVVQSLEHVFEYFAGRDFAVFGINKPEAIRWFQSMEAVQAMVPSPTYPIFNGGLYYFRKSVQAKEVFERARQLFHSYDALGLHRTGTGTENDEPLMSLAMAQGGLRATDDSRLDVIHAPEPPEFRIHINVLRGECESVWQGRSVRPIIAHFVGDSDRGYEYQREALRLDVAFRGPHFPYYRDGIIRLSAHGKMLWAVGFARYCASMSDGLGTKWRVR